MKRLAVLAAACLAVGCQPPAESPLNPPAKQGGSASAGVQAAPPSAGPEKAKDADKTPPHKFGEKIAEGDLRIRVAEAVSSSQFAGQHYGSFQPVQLMMVHFFIENTSKGKIADWPGWQGQGIAEDEYGNKFKPADLKGWAWLPENNPWSKTPGDFGKRINPGEIYENAAYYQYAPPTSKKIVVAMPVGDRTVRVQGPITQKGSP